MNVHAPGAADAATRVFDPRRLAFTWHARGDAPALQSVLVLAAAERHLQSHHARVEREGDRTLRFGSGSRVRRSWLGAIRGGQLQVSESDGHIVVTVHAGVARMLLICALPAVVVSALGAWPLVLLFACAGAANLWFVDQGARRLIAAALRP